MTPALGVESQPIPTLAFLSYLPTWTGCVHPDCPRIMPLKNPNVGDKSSQFSTDYLTSSIYADPAAGLSSLCQHIGSPWPVDSN
jgi:hypothetical protein